VIPFAGRKSKPQPRANRNDRYILRRSRRSRSRSRSPRAFVPCAFPNRPRSNPASSRRGAARRGARSAFPTANSAKYFAPHRLRRFYYARPRRPLDFIWILLPRPPPPPRPRRFAFTDDMRDEQCRLILSALTFPQSYGRCNTDEMEDDSHAEGPFARVAPREKRNGILVAALIETLNNAISRLEIYLEICF